MLFGCEGAALFSHAGRLRSLAVLGLAPLGIDSLANASTKASENETVLKAEQQVNAQPAKGDKEKSTEQVFESLLECGDIFSGFSVF